MTPLGPYPPGTLGSLAIALRRSAPCRPRGSGHTAGTHEREKPRTDSRNYLTQQAIDGLADGDEAPLHRLLAGLRRPYAPTAEDAPLLGRRPAWAEAHPGCTALSCSS